MIYTITFSPSIDYVINSNNEFQIDDLNRINQYEFVPGGKGINASVVLKRIGFDNKAITFLGGPTKQMFLNLLKDENIELINFDSINETRINIKMFAKNTSFEINGPRATIAKNQYQQLFNFIDKKINVDDFIFIMGICEEEILNELIYKINSKKIQFALDIDSKSILRLLKYKPTIIKPNRLELASLFDTKIESIDDIKKYMNKLQDEGLKYVLVSDGKNGSYFLDNNKDFYHIKLNKKFNIVSTVGAGDTLISSFIMLYLKTKDLVNSLKQATSLSIGTSMVRFVASKDDLNKYINDIEVIKI